MSGAPRFSRRVWPIAALGLVGVLSLLLKPVPAALLDQAPALAALPLLAQRGLLLGNPLALLLAAALVGAAVAHRVGLGSVLAGTVPPTNLLRTLGGAAAAGFAMGMLLATIDALIAPHLGDAWLRLMATANVSTTELVTGLLYGGLAEEVMLRWGFMSLVGWALVSVFGERGYNGSVAVSIVIAAALFGAAHLPALAAEIELTPWLIGRTLLINGAAGVLYGWIFWRHHLEAAMTCHAATHTGLAAWRVLMI